MTTLREAAQQALEALENIDKEFRKHGRKHWPEAVKAHSAIAPLRAALAEPENWELRRLSEELERCKQTCAATSEAWREEAALAEPQSTAEHISSPECWCHPELNYVDPVTGAKVWVHKEIQ